MPYDNLYSISIKINSTRDLEVYHRLLTKIEGPIFLLNNSCWYNGRDVLALNDCNFRYCIELFCSPSDALILEELKYPNAS